MVSHEALYWLSRLHGHYPGVEAIRVISLIKREASSVRLLWIEVVKVWTAHLISGFVHAVHLRDISKMMDSHG